VTRDAVESSRSRPLTAPVPFFPFIRSDREIDLAFERIDAHNEDPDLIADAESLVISSANELPSSPLE
jgi:hypothetical protein